MIVISGALVLVAAVLLLLGLVSGSISLVYAAIGLSLVGAVFLLVGVFQRPPPGSEAAESEGEPRTKASSSKAKTVGQEPGDDESAPVAAASKSDEAARDIAKDDPYDDLDAAAEYPLEPADPDFEKRSGEVGADVLVISGRPRYHVGGCEYVEGSEDSEPLEINEARELGFTPCGVCRPNETLARSAAGRDAEQTHARPVPAPAAPPAAVAAPTVTADDPPTMAAPVIAAGAAAQNGNSADHGAAAQPGSNGVHPAPVTAEQPAAPAPAAQPVAYAPAPPVAAAPAQPTAEPAAPAVAAPISAAPVPPAATAPAPAAPAAASAPPVAEPVAEQPAAPEPAAAAPAPEPAPLRTRVTGRTVFAVASNREYHRPDCALLQGASAEEITRGVAVRQGYLACAVCRP